MNRTLYKRVTPLLMMGMLSLLSCVNTITFHTGTFNGEPYKLAYREKKGFTTNSIYHEVKIGRRKWVKIDPNTTDWEPPYADDLFGSARRVYIDKIQASYGNEPDNAVSHRSTMLYLSPSRFSQKAFEQYATFMQREWPGIDRLFGYKEYSGFPHIIGLVYGEHDAFTRLFTGKKGDKIHSIQVRADGRILYFPDSRWDSNYYGGLSEKVQMPGKVIYVTTGKNVGLSLAEVQACRDAAGKSVADYFMLREKPTPTADISQ